MQLLVSVSSIGEVQAAVAGGADIIDVKNPAEGSLGAPQPHLIREVRRLTPRHLPVSAAIGDVPDLPGTVALAAAAAAACGADFVKIGLMGPCTPRAAGELLAAAVRAVGDVDRHVRVIATGYADGEQVGALPPRDLVQVARAAGAHGCMLDTARKGKGSLFDALSHEFLSNFVAESRLHRLLSALAGSLALADLPDIRGIGPDIAGFRSAACQGDRIDGHVDSLLVQSLRDGLKPTEDLPYAPRRATPTDGAARSH